MLITTQTIIRVNKKFGNGNLINNDSLDFATKTSHNGFLGNLPHIIRALLVDHCFEDGNKRTAAFLILKFCEDNKIKINQERLIKTIIDISKTNPKEIKKIRRMIKYALGGH